MEELRDIDFISLLKELDEELISLLSNLSPEEWLTLTLAQPWTIKDVASHLLDGNLRSLSMLRDGFFGVEAPKSSDYKNMVTFLNGLNSEWTAATKRLSPNVIIRLLKITGPEYIDHLKTLPPMEDCLFSVDWVGQKKSKNWFHVAREYTEKWHHQQQIRYAIGDMEYLLEEKFYLPYLQVSLSALPFHYSSIERKDNVCIDVIITGSINHCWQLVSRDKMWEFIDSYNGKATSRIVIPHNLAWRIFTKGIDKKKAIEMSKIEGDLDLGLRLFDLIAVMA